MGKKKLPSSSGESGNLLPGSGNSLSELGDLLPDLGGFSRELGGSPKEAGIFLGELPAFSSDLVEWKRKIGSALCRFRSQERDGRRNIEALDGENGLT